MASAARVIDSAPLRSAGMRLPARYRHGIGPVLLRHALAADDSAAIECTVLAGNDHARALYESAGFVVVGTKTGKPAGNERFAATGHAMEWHRP